MNPYNPMPFTMRYSVFFTGLMLTLFSACRPSANELSNELKSRSRAEGLALVRVQSNWINIVDFNRGSYSIRNPRDLSKASLGNNGVVGWIMAGSSYGKLIPCPPSWAPVIVENPGEGLMWQLPGAVGAVHEMAVSPDGKKVAFGGRYEVGFDSSPPASGFYYAAEGGERAFSVSQDQSTTRDLDESSWSPDSSSFVYGLHNRIYVFDIRRKQSVALAAGSDPSWSPDGALIAFRDQRGTARVINLHTHEINTFLGGINIMGSVHWSPDSKYVMVGVRSTFVSKVIEGTFLSASTGHLIVYRLADQMSTIVGDTSSEGYSDEGFYWVQNLETFLTEARIWPRISPCVSAKRASR